MANQEHLDILTKGVGAWNEWRRNQPHGVSPPPADLGGAALSHAHLNGAYLYGADMQVADLSGAKLMEADLAYADLSHANLIDADLKYANLNHATLSNADLSWAQTFHANLSNANLFRACLFGADLRGADLCHAILIEAEASGTIMGSTVLGDVDLSMTGLECINHLSPSFIGVDTIYRSRGQIPESFLRGAGVPENFITYMRSLTGAAFEFYSCFISYSTKDQEFADHLYADLQAKGVRCWFAPHDIRGGQKVHEQIDQAIKVYDKLLLILSDASMNSPWVKTEIANARAREEQQKRQMLFPLTLVPFDQIKAWKLFDADTGIDSAREIREYFVPDFSNWEDGDSYTRAFERLLRDLKAGPGEQTGEAK